MCGGSLGRTRDEPPVISSADGPRGRIDVAVKDQGRDRRFHVLKVRVDRPAAVVRCR